MTDAQHALANADRVASEATRLVIERMLAAPETWRARAIALAGVLGGFTVATIGGLWLAVPRSGLWTSILAVLTLGAYVAGLVWFFRAAVTPIGSVQTKPGDPLEYLNAINDKTREEVKAIRKRTVVAGWLGLTAIILSAVTLVLSAFAGDRKSGTITLDQEVREKLEEVCTFDIPPSYYGVVEGRPSDDVLTLTFPPFLCMEHSVKVDVARTDFLLAED